MGGTPLSQLVNLLSARVHEASESAPPSSGAPSPSVEGQWAPSHLGPAPKRACCIPTTTTSVASKEDDVTMQEVPLPTDPSKAIAGPSQSSLLLAALQGDLPSLTISLNLHFLLNPSSKST